VYIYAHRSCLERTKPVLTVRKNTGMRILTYLLFYFRFERMEQLWCTWPWPNGHFYRSTPLSAICKLSSCVCLSVTCRYCVQMAKLRITQTTQWQSRDS